MKNKNLMLLLGVGVAYYIFYKMYANKNNASVVKTPVMPPVINYPSPYTDVIDVTSVPNQFLVDKVNTAEISYEPNTYQTYYGSMAGNGYKVPSTC
jgi:hypothetical protein